MMQSHVFSYRLQGPSISVLGFFVAVFGGLMVFMSWLEGDRFIGIPLGYPFGAMFYLALAAISFLSIFLLYRAWQSQKEGERQIVFGEDRVTLPKNAISNQLVTIRYAAISEVSQQSATRTAMTFIRIKHEGGSTQISDLGFERQDDFQQVYKLLRQRAGLSG